jgi:hypothetical protein
MTTEPMTTEFVAVVRAEAMAYRPALLAAGASVVLSWAELATSTEPDDALAVLFDVPDLLALPGAVPGALPGAVPDGSGFADQLTAVLSSLPAVDSDRDSTTGPLPADRDVVIATVRPVIDTLKLVDAAGVLTGTAERDEHRFVGTPIVARLRVLRAAFRELDGTAPGLIPPTPTPVAILAALVARGATVLGSQ